MKRTRSLTCKGKKGYATKKMAQDAMYSYARRQLGGIKMNAEVYKCVCGKWKWGHFRPSKNKGRK